MNARDDVIVAIATPPGRGGMAVVRLSGARAGEIAAGMLAGSGALEARRATFATLQLAAGDGGEGLRDEAIVTLFRAPASYTGEDVVEIAVHGSPPVAEAVVAGAIGLGARLAGRGEFTLRAFLNGRIDLAQAEAVADLVAATTPLQARVAFDQLEGTLSGRIAGIDREVFELAAGLEASIDFPEAGYHFVEPEALVEALGRIAGEIDELLAESARGRLVREGATVAIVGRTNVGKSTVFNRLAGAERAIVTEVPGTTRDLLAETVSFEGIAVTLVDTAGVRRTGDPVEHEGVRRAERARGAAALVVLVLDGSAELDAEDVRLLSETAAQERVIVVNKADLARAWAPEAALGDAGRGVVAVSALEGRGFDELVAVVATRLGGMRGEPPPRVSNLRHVELLRQARENLAGAISAIDQACGHMPEEIVLSELQATREALEAVTGRRTSEDMLEQIFRRFCVGK